MRVPVAVRRIRSVEHKSAAIKTTPSDMAQHSRQMGRAQEALEGKRMDARTEQNIDAYRDDSRRTLWNCAAVPQHIEYAYMYVCIASLLLGINFLISALVGGQQKKVHI